MHLRQTCIHHKVSKSKTKNEACRKLVSEAGSGGGAGCRHYKNVGGLIGNRDFRRGGAMATWDIEEIVAAGKRKKSCPYFATRELMVDADIVFCPYNYLIDPTVRDSLGIKLDGNIVILDEGHNVEDAVRRLFGIIDSSYPACDGSYFMDCSACSPWILPVRDAAGVHHL
jgi:Fanconi anemia group J protein